ncbi:VOC family protein [Amycolatopsis palatopharyngis]|uniref:VOC family protein n=1 Tax=Amycolatopsis palatopharyngis TaxID=187982 RepID=UPI000E266A08|nr:VOC family protein [Amycolatopsis palatopharyngis]
MTDNDPLAALRRPHQPIDPDPAFAEDLRERLRSLILPSPTTTTGEAMTITESTQAVPRADYHSISPYLVVDNAWRALDFYVEVFGAEHRGEPIVMEDGRIGHAEVAIGDSVLMMAEEFPEVGHVAGPGGASLRVETIDVDATLARAVDQGAEVLSPAEDRGHGRTGTIRDPFGQRWLVSQAPRRSSAGAPAPRHGHAAYFTLTAPDDEAARSFYGAVLGWQFATGTVPRAWQVEGSGLPDAGIWGGQDYPGWKLMYAVDDLDSAVERVAARGGLVRETKQEPYGRTADCVDDQGIEFWLWEG